MTGQYNDRFRRFAGRVEKGIMIGIVVCALGLAVGEILIQYMPVRLLFVETERLEGVPRFR